MLLQKIELPYDRSTISALVEKSRIKAILRNKINASAKCSQEELVLNALENPIGSPRLNSLAVGCRNILVVTSDHTRPVPSRVMLPLLLSEIRSGAPDANIKVLIATGLHRPMTEEEMKLRFGGELFKREEFVNHLGYDAKNMVFKGILPSGGELWLNSLVDWADLIVSEGFIEPHFFAGFSGGRKSILPGIASEKTVLANHCASFISDSHSIAGNLEGNLIHEDMLFAAEAVNLGFILNVVLDEAKQIAAAFAGDRVKAHLSGCEFASRLFSVKAVKSDIVVVSNGGYPLDQNIYQAVKGMTAAELSSAPGSVIIMASACKDGHGGKAFYNYFKNAESPEKLLAVLEKNRQDETEIDQWEAQILARILSKRKVIIIADESVKDIVEDMFMTYAHTLEEALAIAEGAKGKDASITVIPDGVSVVVT
ncbi:MAG: nickel-dependent lactate racemase [Clostridiales bacterium]|jgi:nickel-dependent lactate racemase|nr:nickel-dependent lactate racemase [Clostridiales bacterium]